MTSIFRSILVASGIFAAFAAVQPALHAQGINGSATTNNDLSTDRHDYIQTPVKEQSKEKEDAFGKGSDIPDRMKDEIIRVASADSAEIDIEKDIVTLRNFTYQSFYAGEETTKITADEITIFCPQEEKDGTFTIRGTDNRILYSNMTFISKETTSITLVGMDEKTVGSIDKSINHSRPSVRTKNYKSKFSFAPSDNRQESNSSSTSSDKLFFLDNLDIYIKSDIRIAIRLQGKTITVEEDMTSIQNKGTQP